MRELADGIVGKLKQATGLKAKLVKWAMKVGAALPMGPFALLDVVGLDVSAGSEAIQRCHGRRSPATPIWVAARATMP